LHGGGDGDVTTPPDLGLAAGAQQAGGQQALRLEMVEQTVLR